MHSSTQTLGFHLAVLYEYNIRTILLLVLFSVTTVRHAIRTGASGRAIGSYFWGY